MPHQAKEPSSKGQPRGQKIARSHVVQRGTGNIGGVRHKGKNPSFCGKKVPLHQEQQAISRAWGGNRRGGRVFLGKKSLGKQEKTGKEEQESFCECKGKTNRWRAQTSRLQPGRGGGAREFKKSGKRTRQRTCDMVRNGDLRRKIWKEQALSKTGQNAKVKG